MKIILLIIAAVFATGGLPGEAEASLAGTVAKAALKRGAPVRVATTSMARRNTHVAVVTGKPRDVLLSRTRYPESAAHIDHAQRMGQPTVLTLDRVGAAKRRQASLQHIKRRSDRSITGLDRDEYPPAMTKQGGFNANVRFIGASDNRGAGKAMERQVNDLPDGSNIRVLVTK